MTSLINFTDPIALLQSLVQSQGIPGTHKDSFFVAVVAEGLAAFCKRETVSCHLLLWEAQGERAQEAGRPLL